MALEPKFLTPLRVEQIDERDWRVTDDFLYQCRRLNRVVRVANGFVTDFASVPRLPLVYLLTGGVAVRAATLHDWFYRGGEEVTRRDADAVFAEVMKVTGQPFWRRFLMWINLRIWGWWAWRQNHAYSGLSNSKAKAIDMVNAASPGEKAETMEKAEAMIEKVPVPAAASVASAAVPEAKHGEVVLSIPPIPDPVPPEMNP